MSFTDLDQGSKIKLFLSQFWPHLKQAPFFEATGAVAKIGPSLKLNRKLSLPKSVKHTEQKRFGNTYFLACFVPCPSEKS